MHECVAIACCGLWFMDSSFEWGPHLCAIYEMMVKDAQRVCVWMYACISREMSQKMVGDAKKFVLIIESCMWKTWEIFVCDIPKKYI